VENEITVHLPPFPRRLGALHLLILTIIFVFIYLLVEFLKFLLKQRIDDLNTVVFIISLVLIAIGSVTAYTIRSLTRKMKP
jgi:uncharacterized protein YqhQ